MFLSLVCLAFVFGGLSLAPHPPHLLSNRASFIYPPVPRRAAVHYQHTQHLSSLCIPLKPESTGNLQGQLVHLYHAILLLIEQHTFFETKFCLISCSCYIYICRNIHVYLEPETSTLKWLFQLDDSNFLHEKWSFHQTSIKTWLFGVPGTYVYLYKSVYM